MTTRTWTEDRPFYWTADPQNPSTSLFVPVERLTNGIYTIETYWWAHPSNPEHRLPSVSVELPGGASANGSIYAATPSYKALLFDWRPFPNYVYAKAWQMCRSAFPEYIARVQKEYDAIA